MKKRRLALSLLCLCLLGNVGCVANTRQNAQIQDTKDDKLKIGFCVDSFLIERWQREKDVFVSRAQELGAEVNVQDANGDIKEQIAQIEYLIQKKVDVIAIIPIDAAPLNEVIKKAKRAGIKIIAYDRLITYANVDLYIL